ncbi:hypothetical protein F9U64_07200 [Gracilibacillus oryzae]|uniref:Core-binding (CB) domain-containing protein n=1 Tax=Gracilibacillus oryzae TaxID=1672701 RepID=A0A7C8L4Q3_9BACI|nr:SEC-C metal-binding domain-containing protein [Gracilibacillus oryzae]KAB8137995.1 hypothetical protein F9U64_07200 [Gracilibacillus oryzae]
MTVGRNDPCPCGSGKKYKKCCMKKDQIVELKISKEEKFYKLKETLAGKLNAFLVSYLTLNIYAPLEAEFNRRTNNIFEKNSKGFFLFWLHFFYRYDNGLRGIEWFLKDEENRLTSEEKEMAQRWVSMKPQLLQMIKRDNEMVTAMDCFSKQTYQLPKSKDNIPHVLPWTSTIGLLEPVNELYYLNGVRTFVSPKALQNAKQLIDEKMKETGLNNEQVMTDYYPEVLAAFYSNDEKTNNADNAITLYEYRYKLLDRSTVENYISNDHDLALEAVNANKKRYIWLSDTSIYKDNQIDGEVLLAKVNGTLELVEDILTFTTYDPDINERFIKKVESLEGSIELIENKQKKITTYSELDIQQYVANPSKNVPEYFSIYAQTMAVIKPDETIPEYGQSLRELVQNGEKEVAENWFRKMEYEVTKVVNEHFTDAGISPDFNTPRKEVGLPISPFVTGGEERASKFILTTIPNQNERTNIEGEASEYDILGIRDRMIYSFYAKDLLTFYQEKTDGKAKATERKYRNAIKDIIDVLEIRAITSWEQCDLHFWESLLAKDIVRMYTYITKSYIKTIITTVKALGKWLQDQKKVMLEDEINQLAKKYEPILIKIAQIWDAEMLFEIPEESLNNQVLLEKLSNYGLEVTELKKGQYKVTEIKKDSVVTINLDDQKKQTILLNENSVPFAEKGMVLVTNIGKDKTTNSWKSVYIETIYFDID